MFYSKKSIPDWVKKFKEPVQDVWLKEYNLAYKKDKDKNKAEVSALHAIKEYNRNSKELSDIVEKEKSKLDDVVIDSLSLKESVYDDQEDILEVIIIESGYNPIKERLYPMETILQSPSFMGLKMYINHQTNKEEKERPERDFRNHASTIIEDYNHVTEYNTAQRRAKIKIHSKWLKERLKDSVFKSKAGLSINASGDVSYGKLDGKRVQVVDKIIINRQDKPVSVDWVTEAGARGRVVINESMFVQDKDRQHEKEEKMPNLKEATIHDIQKENPALIQSIKESVLNELKEGTVLKEKDAKIKDTEAKLQEATKKIDAFDLKEKQFARNSVIEESFKDVKLPEIVVTKLKESAKQLDKDGDELKESVKQLILTEREYLNKLSETGKIKMGETKTGDREKSTVETLTESLVKAIG